MKLVIEIPESFEGHFNQDRFKDSFERILEDCKHSAILSGIYEFETIEMLIRAFENGTPLPKGHGRIADIDKVLEEMRATRTYDIPFALERVKPIIESDGSNKDEVNTWICQML